MDRAITTSICRAVGERLRHDLEPDNSQLPRHLQELMEELRRQDQSH